MKIVKNMTWELALGVLYLIGYVYYNEDFLFVASTVMLCTNSVLKEMRKEPKVREVE